MGCQNINKIKIIEIDIPYIYISLNEKKLYYNDKAYNISIGKESTKTPTGRGYVYEKRPDILFVYSEGKFKGKTIRYYTDKNGYRKRIPYKNMRALGIKINGKIRYAIHSTTEEINIGKAVSKGCVRMSIKDMLELYPQVEKGTIIIIE
jgi:lipoprotein-anchoring transpeptidase ErfK/SrfK